MQPAEAKKQLAEALEERSRRLREDSLRYYSPYPKQSEFHAAGVIKRERLLSGGNQTGKTYPVAREVAMHLTGRYPDWWKGKVFNHPVRGWCAGVTSESVRDNAQRQLLGIAGEWGTGAIPRECLGSTDKNIRMSTGLRDTVDIAYVKHKSGGTSELAFKSYQRGREVWQGPSLHFVWDDEEPPPDIYSEGLARLAATKGIMILSATPLLGMSSVMHRFMGEDHPDRFYVQVSLDEAEHIPESERQSIIEGYPEHERECRVYGRPMLGSGRVFPVAEEAIKEKQPELSPHWPRIVGLDFGWDHPTAAAWLAWDRDADVVHVYACHKQKEEIPSVHASAIKSRGSWIPVAWPHDGFQTEKGSGKPLAELYRKEGLKMLPDNAKFGDGSISVEAGIQDMLTRMRTGRLKVAYHLEDWWKEFRVYHRKDGRIVKLNDDLISATRYALMSLRYAKLMNQDRDYQRLKRAYNKQLNAGVI